MVTTGVVVALVTACTLDSLTIWRSLTGEEGQLTTGFRYEDGIEAVSAYSKVAITIFVRTVLHKHLCLGFGVEVPFFLLTRLADTTARVSAVLVPFVSIIGFVGILIPQHKRVWETD